MMTALPRCDEDGSKFQPSDRQARIGGVRDAFDEFAHGHDLGVRPPNTCKPL